MYAVDRWAIQEEMAKLQEGPEKQRLRQMLVDDNAGRHVNPRDIPKYKPYEPSYTIGGEM